MLAVGLGLVAGPAAPARGGVGSPPAPGPVVYSPPVAASVTDGFRLEHGPYGPGNRGLEYTTVPGTPVRAIGSGRVVFAGRVAGSRHVTVVHPDGLRSSYSYLAAIEVAVGERLDRGDLVGAAGSRLHLGVRAGGAYLDPATLWSTGRIRLVPDRE